ncbi:aminopeptidase P family protein [Nakamurella silvestris]|nr:aminopeptidase P family protein [Nakamurella silvestris]
MENWDQRDESALNARVPVADFTAGRRARLAAAFPGEILVVPTGKEIVRASDNHYPFRAGSDFMWLVGDPEPSRVLVIDTRPESAGHTGTVYAPERSGMDSDRFHTDRVAGELWVGVRRGPVEIAAAFGVGSAPWSALAEIAAITDTPIRLLAGIDPEVDALFALDTAGAGKRGDGTELAQVLGELRMIKDSFEVTALERAVAATAAGFDDVLAEIRQAAAVHRGERWLEGTFWRRARLDGNEVGYGSVIACGHNATTLHWQPKVGRVVPGELLLLDMGVETDDLYTADVTRTIPVSGTFSPTQRQVYEAVLNAQQAGIDAVRPGAAFLDPHWAAMRSITRSLLDWGILTGDLDDLVSEQMYRRWTLHSTSHHLGIDVHDCATARAEFYKGGNLAEGMVITVEPGLYFQHFDLSVPAEFRGIGVRIEDDILVTAEGSRVLSADLPRSVAAVEAWMDGRAAV